MDSRRQGVGVLLSKGGGEDRVQSRERQKSKEPRLEALGPQGHPGIQGWMRHVYWSKTPSKSHTLALTLSRHCTTAQGSEWLQCASGATA